MQRSREIQFTMNRKTDNRTDLGMTQMIGFIDKYVEIIIKYNPYVQKGRGKHEQQDLQR